MTSKNRIKTFLAALVSLVILTACDNDGDTIYLDGLEQSELIASETAVVLSQETAKQIVLSLAWTESTLAISDPEMSAPDVFAAYLQVSTTDDFSANLLESAESNLSRAYTGAELNTLAKNLSLEPDRATPVYFRIKSSIGNNMTPKYSEPVTVDITSYVIDMSIGFVLNSDMEDTGFILASPNETGLYTGYLGATGWYNWYMMEGDGTTWGNDGVDGSPFLLSSEEDDDKRWNFWFPGVTGCYYVEVDVNRKQWSALLISALNVQGNIVAPMNFDRANLRWTTIFKATAAGAITVQIDGEGKQYNYTTGTDDDAAINTPVAFGSFTVDIPEAGDYTLILDLSNPNNQIVTAERGSLEPEENYPYLYIPGVDDGISGSWTFDNFISLYDEDNLAYAGVVNVHSQWGYYFCPEIENWDNKYSFGEGDALSGTLEYQSANNIPAPDPGVYLIHASLKTLTYDLTALGSEIYLSGLNDVWDFSVSLPQVSPGVYAGSITVSSVSQWGFKIYLIADDWGKAYGGYDGILYYNGNDGIKDDATLGEGTYTLTVDLINGSYTMQ